MSKLPKDVPIPPDLVATLEEAMELYEGEELERAQNALRVAQRSVIASQDTAALLAYYQGSIRAAVERQQHPAPPKGVTVATR